MPLTLEDGETCIFPILTDKSLKFCFKSGDRKIINSVLESLSFYLFLIIHTRISEIHMFNFVNDSKGSLHLNKMYSWVSSTLMWEPILWCLSIAASESKYKHNFIGPRTEPRGTPHNKLAKSDIIPLIWTLCFSVKTWLLYLRYYNRWFTRNPTWSNLDLQCAVEWVQLHVYETLISNRDKMI